MIADPALFESFWLERARAVTCAPDDAAALDALVADADRLSDGFTTERGPATAGYADSPRALAAYGLYFFPRTLFRTGLILAECESAGWQAPVDATPLRVLDLGAGTGAAGFAACRHWAARPVALTALDRAPASLAVLREAFASAHAQFPLARAETRAGDLAEPPATEGGWHVILCSFALNESDAPDTWLEATLDRLAPGGLLVLCEPAQEASAARLERLRDIVAARGRARLLAPCPHHQPCPLLREGRVWCHEVRRWTPPDAMLYLNRTLQRDVTVVKFSFLALTTPDAPSVSPSTGRLIAPFTLENGKVTTRLCAHDGTAPRCEILTRHLDRAARDRVLGLERGTRVDWPGLAPLKDGRTLRSASPPAPARGPA